MTEAFTFVQISDTHLLIDDAALNGAQPARQLARIVARIAALPTRPRFVLHSGDAIQGSGAAGYRALRELLAPLDLPLLLSLGNSDERAAYRAVFPTAAGEAGDAERRHRQVYDHDGLRVIVLDSLVPGVLYGELGAAQRAWLAETLATPAPRGTIVALHHPPVLGGFPWLTMNLLRDADEFAAVLSGASVLGVLAGHCHAATMAHFGGTLMVTAPGVAFEITPGLATMATTTASGFNLCEVRDGALLVTTVMV